MWVFNDHLWFMSTVFDFPGTHISLALFNFLSSKSLLSNTHVQYQSTKCIPRSHGCNHEYAFVTPLKMLIRTDTIKSKVSLVAVDLSLKVEDSLTLTWMQKQCNTWWRHKWINIKRRFSLWEPTSEYDCLVRIVSTESIEGRESLGREVLRQTYSLWVLFSLQWLSHRCYSAVTGRITWEAASKNVHLCLHSHTQTHSQRTPRQRCQPQTQRIM